MFRTFHKKLIISQTDRFIPGLRFNCLFFAAYNFFHALSLIWI